ADADVWGVEPTGAAAMHESFEAGQALRLDRVDTVADGLGAPMAGELNYEILSEHARGIVLVEDREIVCAMMILLERTKLLAEPAGAAGLAALLEDKIEFDRTRPVVVVISGGNADLAQLARLIQGEKR
ncbi:MAG: pyridoxal-phosphate dependent enzyme, partial [Longimicrobiales bacterium]